MSVCVHFLVNSSSVLIRRCAHTNDHTFMCKTVPPPVPVPLSPSPRLPQQTMCCDRKKHNKLILPMIAQFHHIAQKVTGKNTTKCLQWQRPYNRLMEDPFQSFYLLTCYCETCGICAYVKPFCTHWGANTSGPRDRLCKPTQADMWRL